jgi:hypothetical protein
MNNSTVLPSLNNAQSKFLEIRKGIVVSHRIIRQRDKRTATGTSVRTQYEIRFDGHTGSILLV